MSVPGTARCEACEHFRVAPYEARVEGCYLPSNMSQRQTDAFLDEQQIPGDHRKINLRGNCPDFAEKPVRLGLWRRLMAR